jgi:hypothetical protein
MSCSEISSHNKKIGLFGLELEFKLSLTVQQADSVLSQRSVSDSLRRGRPTHAGERSSKSLG